MPTRTIVPIAPTDPMTTIPGLGVGRGDRSISLDDGAWIALRTVDGPATLRFEADDSTIRAESWGDGAEAALDLAPGLVGALDDPAGFDPSLHPTIDRLARLQPLARITRSGLVAASLLRIVIGQKVIGNEAKRSYRAMTLAQAQRAPGPRQDLLLPPSPAWITSLDYADFHPWGVERRRAETLLEVARRAKRLDEAAAMPLDAAYERITAVRGVGRWSAALVGMEALGDADAVPVGDYHLPNTVAWALAGEDRADDERMLDLLEPFRPHRARVIRLLKQAGVTAPRYGPRSPLRGIEGI